MNMNAVGESFESCSYRQNAAVWSFLFVFADYDVVLIIANTKKQGILGKPMYVQY